MPFSTVRIVFLSLAAFVLSVCGDNGGLDALDSDIENSHLSPNPLRIVGDLWSLKARSPLLLSSDEQCSEFVMITRMYLVQRLFGAKIDSFGTDSGRPCIQCIQVVGQNCEGRDANILVTLTPRQSAPDLDVKAMLMGQDGKAQQVDILDVKLYAEPARLSTGPEEMRTNARMLDESSAEESSVIDTSIEVPTTGDIIFSVPSTRASAPGVEAFNISKVATELARYVQDISGIITSGSISATWDGTEPADGNFGDYIGRFSLELLDSDSLSSTELAQNITAMLSNENDVRDIFSTESLFTLVKYSYDSTIISQLVAGPGNQVAEEEPLERIPQVVVRVRGSFNIPDGSATDEEIEQDFGRGSVDRLASEVFGSVSDVEDVSPKAFRVRKANNSEEFVTLVIIAFNIGSGARRSVLDSGSDRSVSFETSSEVTSPSADAESVATQATDASVVTAENSLSATNVISESEITSQVSREITLVFFALREAALYPFEFEEFNASTGGTRNQVPVLVQDGRENIKRFISDSEVSFSPVTVSAILFSRLPDDFPSVLSTITYNVTVADIEGASGKLDTLEESVRQRNPLPFMREFCMGNCQLTVNYTDDYFDMRPTVSHEIFELNFWLPGAIDNSDAFFQQVGSDIVAFLNSGELQPVNESAALEEFRSRMVEPSDEPINGTGNGFKKYSVIFTFVLPNFAGTQAVEAALQNTLNGTSSDLRSIFSSDEYLGVYFQAEQPSPIELQTLASLPDENVEEQEPELIGGPSDAGSSVQVAPREEAPDAACSVTGSFETDDVVEDVAVGVVRGLASAIFDELFEDTEKSTSKFAGGYRVQSTSNNRSIVVILIQPPSPSGRKLLASYNYVAQVRAFGGSSSTVLSETTDAAASSASTFAPIVVTNASGTAEALQPYSDDVQLSISLNEDGNAGNFSRYQGGSSHSTTPLILNDVRVAMKNFFDPNLSTRSFSDDRDFPAGASRANYNPVVSISNIEVPTNDIFSIRAQYNVTVFGLPGNEGRRLLATSQELLASLIDIVRSDDGLLALLNELCDGAGAAGRSCLANGLYADQDNFSSSDIHFVAKLGLLIVSCIISWACLV